MSFERYAVGLLLVVSGCAPSSGTLPHGDGGGGDAAALAGLTSIDVMPPTASLTTTNGVAASQAFTATGHFTDGHTADISSMVAWSLADIGLGVLDAGGGYISTTARGGKTDVVANAGAQTGKAQLTLAWASSRVSTDNGSTAPSDSGTRFGGSADPTLAPSIVYPLDGALVPLNLGELEVQWQKPTGPADLFQIALTSALLDLKIYTNAPAPADGRLPLLPAEWAALAETVKGDKVTITVSGVQAASPATVGTSAAVQLQVGVDVVMGGIYYWSAAGSVATSEGINRHEFGDTTGMATPFYTEADGDALFGGTGHCVACHVLSRDGKKFAIGYNGGGKEAALLDVATKTPLIPEGTMKWSFASFNPDSTQMIATSDTGVLRFVDTAASPGTILGTLDLGTATYGTEPDWSADGKSIVYVAVGTPTVDWSFHDGSIVITKDGGSGFSGNKVIAQAASGESNYYPSFSPDGKWVLFNKTMGAGAAGDGYDDDDAELYVVPADGSSGPIRLTIANATGNLTNSWPRWSPFVQQNGPNGDLYYFTFSSKRDYGVELVGLRRPQIWMAAFDPQTAATGADPSFAPFWLPFQDSATSNHIAQWTTTIVPIQ